MKKQGSGWKGESRRHSLARKGVKTNLPDGRRFDVSKFVANGKQIDWGNPDWKPLRNELIKLEDNLTYPSGNTTLNDLREESKKLYSQIEQGFRDMGHPDNDDYWLEGLMDDYNISNWVDQVIRDMCDDYLGIQKFGNWGKTPPLYEYLENGGGF